MPLTRTHGKCRDGCVPRRGGGQGKRVLLVWYWSTGIFLNLVGCGIDFAPTMRSFAVGSADSLVSLWSLDNLICVRTLGRLGNPIRAAGFSGDGSMLASGSEDKFIDVASAATGEQICSVPTQTSINAIAWHPNSPSFGFADESVGGVHLATLDATDNDGKDRHHHHHRQHLQQRRQQHQ